MHVRVNTTRHYKLASRVKDLIKISTGLYLGRGVIHTLNLVPFDNNISLELSILVDNGTILDQDRGREMSLLWEDHVVTQGCETLQRSLQFEYLLHFIVNKYLL